MFIITLDSWEIVLFLALFNDTKYKKIKNIVYQKRRFINSACALKAF